MLALIPLLMIGMIGLVLLFGGGGFITGLVLGTSTADTFTKAIFPIGWSLAIMVIFILRVAGKRRKL
jgi:hypothetical protein